MVLKAIHVSDVPNLLDQVQENAALALCSSRFTKCGSDEAEDTKQAFKFPKFVVMGHRGSGMNMLQSSDRRFKSIKENSILSFKAAAKLPLDFIEFDAQGAISEKRVTDLNLAELLTYGPQVEAGKIGKPLFRKTKDGRIFEWKVEQDDHICTLQEVFLNVDNNLGFNIELKFGDQIVYKEDELTHILQAILKVVLKHAKDRPIMFSSFQPDAALLMRKLQTTYPVFFLTNGGSEIYTDVRRNSLDEAIKVCMEGGLQGIVSEVKAIFRNPDAVRRIKDSKLSLVSYGQLNNVPEVVHLQQLMGVEGVIVDLVQEVTNAVSEFSFTDPGKEIKELFLFGKDGKLEMKSKLQISGDDFSVLLKLMPELIQS